MTKNRFLQHVQKTGHINWAWFGIAHATQSKLFSTCNFFSQEPTKSYKRIIFFYQKVRNLPFLCLLIWLRWFNFIVQNLSVSIWLNFASVFDKLFVNSNKKQWQKSGKKILPTYLSYFSGVCTPSDIFSYCWISFSDKYVKQVVLINHSSISLILQKRWEMEFCLFFKTWGRVHFSSKNREVGKIVDEWKLLRENNLVLLANLCVYKFKKHYNPRYICKSNKLYYIHKFFR